MVVFFTGACVLIIELVATRILSPYYGNTIFTVTSVITIVLAALSVGYYYGGKLADKHPSEKLFYSIILFSGLGVLFLHLLNLYVLPLLGYELSIITGPIISSVVLFFFPSFLLGMLSPFAIKLQLDRFPKQGTGSLTGEMFFWSTMGSLFGSISTGFILIPQFEISKIILAVALFLTLLGFLPMLKMGMSKKKAFRNAFLIFLAFFLMGTATGFAVKKEKVVYSKNGLYEKITIYDAMYQGQPTRFFEQDRSNSGAMFLNSDEHVDDYTKYFALYKVFNPNIKNALVIGGGAYTVPKALLAENSEVHVDVAEIEPSLFDLAVKYFRVPKTERLKNYTDDGRRLLHDTKKTYDYIFADGYYSLFSIPSHLTTQEFFAVAKSKLGKDGIFIANFIGDLSRRQPSLILSEMRTFQSVFPNSYFFGVNSPNQAGAQNIIFVGYNSDKKIAMKDPLIAESVIPVIRFLPLTQIDINRFELSAYPILTDDYSPVEYMTGKILKKTFSEKKEIDGEEILALIEQQLRYGPRSLNASGHKEVQKFLIAELRSSANIIKIQEWKDGNDDLMNIIARFSPEKKNRIILGAHYDSKKNADRDLFHKDGIMPGANDSASGVAILLHLAERLKNNKQLTNNVGVDIVMFDGEEGKETQGGDYTNWKPLGANYFAEHIKDVYQDNKPNSAIVLDMVCDKNLNIKKEVSSIKNAPTQTELFWKIGQTIDKNAFLDNTGYDLGDDHTSLNEIGIPSFLVIDFDYPYFHTTADTSDKCSAKSLETVGNTVLEYLKTL